jgi:hypothetical protein
MLCLVKLGRECWRNLTVVEFRIAEFVPFSLEICLEGVGKTIVGVFCTGKNMVVKITRFNFEMILRTIKHTMIYSDSGSSSEVIALRPTV